MKARHKKPPPWLAAKDEGLTNLAKAKVAHRQRTGNGCARFAPPAGAVSSAIRWNQQPEAS